MLVLRRVCISNLSLACCPAGCAAAAAAAGAAALAPLCCFLTGFCGTGGCAQTVVHHLINLKYFSRRSSSVAPRDPNWQAQLSASHDEAAVLYLAVESLARNGPFLLLID